VLKAAQKASNANASKPPANAMRCGGLGGIIREETASNADAVAVVKQSQKV
jgi:hypothetical protein